MTTRTLLFSAVLVGCSCGGEPLPGTDAGAVDAAGTDAPGTDVGAVDAPGTDTGPVPDAPFMVLDVGPRLDAGPPGELDAVITAWPEVARIPATGAPASDSEVELDAVVAGGVTSIRWQVFHSETNVMVAEGTTLPMTFTCPPERAAYDVALTIGDGVGSATWRERRLVTCTLPRVAAGRTVHDVDLGTASYFQNGRIGSTVVMPGDVIRVHGTFSRNWVFLNFHGTAEEPIHIINDGIVTNTTMQKSLHLLNCRHVIVDGFGDGYGDDATHEIGYGIVLTNDAVVGMGQQAFYVRSIPEGTNPIAGSTDIEVFGVHVTRAPNTGLQVDTHGSAEFNETNWRFDDLSIHHTRVENTGREGFYLGYTRDYLSATGGEMYVAYPIYDARVYRNIIRNTGYDGLQVGNLIAGTEVHDNVVTEAAANLPTPPTSHESSLQINSGTSGYFYDNLLLGGTGVNAHGGCSGGDLFLFSNVIERALARCPDGTPMPCVPAAPDPTGAAVYFAPGISDGTIYYVFDNTIRTREVHGVIVNFETAGPTACGAPASLDAIVVMNNVVVLPDDTVGGRTPLLFRYDSRMIDTPIETLAPNVAQSESEIAELCFRDVTTGDFAIACATSPALATNAASLSSLAATTPSALPGGFFSDRTARVFADPASYGAYQLLAR
jgi:hypothetical protein